MELRSAGLNDSGWTCALTAIVTGTILAVGVGLILSRIVVSASDIVVVTVLVGMGLGGLALTGFGFRIANESSRFGVAKGTIAQSIVHPGDEIDFTFRQKFHRQIQVRQIYLFLVYREHVKYQDDEDSWCAVVLDRCAERMTFSGRKYDDRLPLKVTHRFRIPNRHMNLRNSLMHHKNASVEAGWVVVVHLETEPPEGGWSSTHWKSFWVDVRPDLRAAALPNAPDASGVFYDLMLEGVRPDIDSKVWEAALLESLPFVQSTEHSGMLKAVPCVLMERAPLEEVLGVKRKLEAAGLLVHFELTQARA